MANGYSCQPLSAITLNVCPLSCGRSIHACKALYSQNTAVRAWQQRWAFVVRCVNKYDGAHIDTESIWPVAEGQATEATNWLTDWCRVGRGPSWQRDEGQSYSLASPHTLTLLLLLLLLPWWWRWCLPVSFSSIRTEIPVSAQPSAHATYRDTNAYTCTAVTDDQNQREEHALYV